MVAIKIIELIGYSTEDPKHPAISLLSGKKWLSARNSRSVMNEVTFQLEKCTVISAIDIGNHGTAIVTIEVSRTGLRSYHPLIPACEFMTRKDSLDGKNITSVKMFTKEDMCEETREEMWDRMKVTCSQPFSFVQFGLSFVKIFSYEERPLVDPSSLSPPPMGLFTKHHGPMQKTSSLSRSERLILEATKSRRSLVSGSACSLPETDGSNSTRENNISKRQIPDVNQAERITEENRPAIKSPRAERETGENRLAINNPRKILSKEHKSAKDCSPKFRWKPRDSLREQLKSKVVRENKESESPSFCSVNSEQSVSREMNRNRPTGSSKRESNPGSSLPGFSKIDFGSETTRKRSQSEETNSSSSDNTVVMPLSEDAGSANSDNTILLIPSSPDSMCSIGTVTLVMSSSEEKGSEREDNAKVLGKRLAGNRPQPKEMHRAKKKVKTSHPESNCVVISDTESNDSLDIASDAMLRTAETHRQKSTVAKQSEIISCPLCSRDFPASEIEQHAAFCEPDNECEESQGGECPMCLKYFPKEILMQHADLCLDTRP